VIVRKESVANSGGRRYRPFWVLLAFFPGARGVSLGDFVFRFSADNLAQESTRLFEDIVEPVEEPMHQREHSGGVPPAE